MHRVEGFLRRALHGGRLAHAYALYGPFLEEKRDVALRVAAAYLAVDTGESEEELAARIARGGEVDRVYVAAREGKLRIDDVRALRDVLSLAPSRGRHRVVWLELREPPLPEAQNALLKLLEEPPTGTLFFVAARSPEGLLPTVRSRLLPLVFPLPPYERRKEIYVRRGFTAEAAAALAALGDVEDLGRLVPEDLPALLREVAAFVCAPPRSAGERLLWADRVLGRYGKEGAAFALAYAMLFLGELLRQSVGAAGEGIPPEFGVSLANCTTARSRADLYASFDAVFGKFRTYSATRTALAFKAALVGLK